MHVPGPLFRPNAGGMEIPETVVSGQQCPSRGLSGSSMKRAEIRPADVRRASGERALDQILGVETQAADVRDDRRPAILEEVLALGRAKLVSRPGGHEHPDPTLREH